MCGCAYGQQVILSEILVAAPGSFKAQLPECDGIENVQIDTIHGVLKYKRPGADGKVSWAPPSALRKIDLILIDEASQYDDREFVRLYQSIKEQPNSPYTAIVADFQQIQPIGSGQKCFNFCMKLPIHNQYLGITMI